MKAKRIREAYTLGIIDQGKDKGLYQWCVVAFDVNDNQVPQLQGYEWCVKNDITRQVGNKSIWLERPKPAEEKSSP